MICNKDNVEKILLKLNNKKIYIVGFGKNGKNIAKYLNDKQIDFCGYVDIKTINNEKENVIRYEDVDLNAVYIISSPENENEMIKKLKENNVNDDKIISFCRPWIMEEILNEVYKYDVNYSSKIKCFKNINEGQSCFIIGNGPSLQLRDLEVIHKNKIKTFAANCIYALYGQTKWRPTYYVASDTSMTNNILLNDLSIALDGVTEMFTSVNSKMIKFNDNKKINYLIQIMSKDIYTGLPEFSSECDKRVFLSGTVSYQMLQLAAYMGFKNIYLLGIDCSYAIERQKNGNFKKNNVLDHNYIIQKYEENLVNNAKISSCWADVNMQINGFMAAKRYCDKNRIKIYNATRGGKLEVFERSNFDMLF